MRTQRRTQLALPSAIAGVEASDTRYRNGQPELTRRRTLALRVRPVGLWITLAVLLMPSLWPLIAAFSRLALQWLVLILS